ncbi:DUF4352 domain-containing protein [Micromonospora cathayae]|uniref:DUF4352 domain-containing protein n=1 Tax=Micromonospora cathayae TaxID=3028804 RepID=A0ABY7ZV18_9ACTN|nr:DUF4352 domain-containing protein [Micromonospora sp. HUAS 3]WDZ86713.1 DUF4352 domain-containing protein [Micromonospora sp. HUAS 3]
MSHPPGPPQDPYQPDPDPYGYSDPQYHPDPTAPPPAYPPGSPAYPPGGSYPPTTPYPAYQPEPSTPVPPYPTSGAPESAYPPVSGAPGYPPPSSGAPGYPPPSSGAPGYPPPGSGAPGYPPPSSGAPGYPPVSGAPGYPPPVSGAPGYPPASGAPGYPPPLGGALPPGPAYGPGPGYPPGPPYAPAKSSGGGGKALLVVGIIAAALVLLCCAGLAVVALTGDEIPDQDPGYGLPTSGSSNAPLIAPTDAAPGLASSPTAAAPEPTRTRNDGETFDMKVGDTLVITDSDGTLEVTINRFTTSNKGCRSFAPDPDEGMYLIADVTARVTKGTASINPFYFEWVADDGTTTNGLIGALSGCGNPLDSGVNLRTGSKRSGTVVFDVADKKGVVEYQHNFEAAGSWKP